VQKILNRTQIRAYDSLAADMCGIPGLILMENAGAGAARIINDIAKELQTRQQKFCIVCGTGNNGGDGFVVARHLAARDDIGSDAVVVWVIGSPEDITGDALANFTALARCGLTAQIWSDQLHVDFHRDVSESSVIVDALYGTGLNRDLDTVRQKVLLEINNATAKRVALDIASGLDADTGHVYAAACRADHTITFAYPKPGIFTPTGHVHSGILHHVSLGFPDALILEQTGWAADIMSEKYVKSVLRPRRATDHKFSAGNVLVVAGSQGTSGAALLCGLAALRSGAGVVTVNSWPETVFDPQDKYAELMFSILARTAISESLTAQLHKKTAVAIGPGFGLDSDAAAALEAILRQATCTVVVDADAITLAAAQPEWVRRRDAGTIMTPHAGEMGRLLGISAQGVEDDRFGAVRRTAEKFQAVTVLKGAHSIIASPDGRTCVSATPNPVLATAGSGDVLTGVITALAAQLPPFEAACAGVYLHAAAADAWCKVTASDRGLLAHEIAEQIPLVIGKMVF
jgi:ADP-dependent NAD(P)H-hydrate dehydratase / NAD(P)H-hydrate epimerase